VPEHGFFDIDRRLESISRMGDPLERLAAEIWWELFRPLLEQMHEKERKSAAGSKPLDVVLRFTVLILLTLYNLADAAVEYQVRDRLSFMRFPSLEMVDSVPDGATVWRFRERLRELKLIKPLFDRFGDYLAQAGLGARNGQIVDASIRPVPIQRNRRGENRRIKAGDAPEDSDEPKCRQKDAEARWTEKHGKSHICETGQSSQPLSDEQQAANAPAPRGARASSAFSAFGRTACAASSSAASARRGPRSGSGVSR
jgi:hypothetical protein